MQITKSRNQYRKIQTYSTYFHCRNFQVALSFPVKTMEGIIRANYSSHFSEGGIFSSEGKAVFFCEIPSKTIVQSKSHARVKLDG